MIKSLDSKRFDRFFIKIKREERVWKIIYNIFKLNIKTLKFNEFDNILNEKIIFNRLLKVYLSIIISVSSQNFIVKSFIISFIIKKMRKNYVIYLL